MLKYLYLIVFLFLSLNLTVFSQESSANLKTGWSYVNDNNTGYKMKLDKDSALYFINPSPIVTSKNIKSLSIYQAANGKKGLLMEFDSEGTEAWRLATRRSIGSYLAFIFINLVLYVPKVNSEITGGVAVLERGNYLQQDLEKIRRQIEKERF